MITLVYLFTIIVINRIILDMCYNHMYNRDKYHHI